MPKGSSFQDMAAEAAERVQEARAMGHQLALLPDEVAPVDGKAGRAPRGEGKAQSQLRKWAVARGFRMPEDVLAEIAGMATSDDVFTWAMARTEHVLAWAQAGATDKVEWTNSEGEVKMRPVRTEPTLTERVETFRLIFTAALRAAEAVLPYGLAKVTPDQGATVVNTIVMPGAMAPAVPVDRANQARDVTPQPRRMAPPPMPHEIQQNQGLDHDALSGSDAASRTQEVSR